MGCKKIADDLAHLNRRSRLYADWSPRFFEKLIHLETCHEAV